MGLLDQLFGQSPQPRREAPDTAAAADTDEQAIARYRYLLRTAPPESIEQAHAEAFARLSPEQRVEVLRRLGEDVPSGERAGDARRVDPETLARLATRAEIRRPGTLERSLGGVGMGGLLAGSLLSAIAGTFIGTAIAHQLLGGFDSAERPEDVGYGATDTEASLEEADADLGDTGDLDGGDLGDL